MTQIITGKFKHRIIKASAIHGRPTKRSVREGIFSALGDITGRSFLDLCAGSGSVGCEALSRGAAPVTLIDATADFHHIKALFNTESIRCIKQDMHYFLKQGPTRPVDIIYLDPPWDRHDLYKKAGRLIYQNQWLAPAGILLIEASRHDDISAITGFQTQPDRVYYYSNTAVYKYNAG